MNAQGFRAAPQVPPCGKRARITLGVAVLAVFVPGTVQARLAERGRSQNVQLVHVANGLLTINVHEVPLSKLLKEIARHSGLALQGQASIAEWITVQFQQVRLEDGLRSILDGQSYALEYSLVTSDEDHIDLPPTVVPLVMRELDSFLCS